MELKPGYKLTEAGLVPIDWDVKPLSEVFIFTGGKAHEQFITEHGRYVVVNSKFISTDGVVRKYTDRNDGPTKRGDILMVMSDLPNGRALAKCFLVDADDRYAVNQRICSLKARRDFPGYLLYQLNRNRYFLKFDDGVQQTHLLNPVVLACPVIVPRSQDEQRAIAMALEDVDGLLDVQEQLIVKKCDLKQAVMQQLLTGKRRLPGFDRTGGKLKQTELGGIPEDWDITEVGELTRSHKQGFYTKNRYVDNGVKLVRITDLMNPLINYEEMPMLHLSRNDRELYMVKIGDFLFARSGAIGRYGIVYEPVEAIFGSYIIRFSFDSSKVKNEYFGFLYETEVVWKQLLSITQGSSNININAANIKSIQIPLPPLEEQRAISEVLGDMDAEIAALEQRRDKTSAIKQGMMQELLTGKTRLI
jgi:type I restriction enzyme S subunit